MREADTERGQESISEQAHTSGARGLARAPSKRPVGIGQGKPAVLKAAAAAAEAEAEVAALRRAPGDVEHWPPSPMQRTWPVQWLVCQSGGAGQLAALADGLALG